MKNGPFKGPFFLAENTHEIVMGNVMFIVQLKKTMS
jgi:hypothetical protein